MSVTRLQRQAGWALPFLLIAAIVGAWELGVRLTNTPLWLLPAPTDVARSLVEDRAILLPNALVTFSEVLMGFACAVVAGRCYDPSTSQWGALGAGPGGSGSSRRVRGMSLAAPRAAHR